MKKSKQLYDYNTLIVGGGIVGLTMALACAHHGIKTALIDRNDFSKPSQDGRAYALSQSSLNLFDHLGISGLREAAEPMRDMQVQEGKRGRKPSPFKLDFAAPDDHPLAFMLEAKLITAALQKQIGVRREEYDQSVIVANFQFEHPHNGISRQIFYHGQPFALLPMTGNRAQIPWFDTHKAIAAAKDLSDEDFIREISLRFHGDYGNIELLSPRYSYPVALQMALGGPILSEYDIWRGLDGRMLAMTTDMLTKLYGIKRGPFAHIRRLGVGAVNKSTLFKKALALEASGTMQQTF